MARRPPRRMIEAEPWATSAKQTSTAASVSFQLVPTYARAVCRFGNAVPLFWRGGRREELGQWADEDHADKASVSGRPQNDRLEPLPSLHGSELWRHLAKRHRFCLTVFP